MANLPAKLFFSECPVKQLVSSSFQKTFVTQKFKTVNVCSKSCTDVAFASQGRANHS